MINGLKKIALIGSLMLAGGVYSGGSLETTPVNEKNIYHEKLTYLLEKQYELYIASDLEKKLKEEKEKFSKPHYLSQDLLNMYIKQAYAEGKKWPEEFDKRLFRLMLRQESRFNAHAKSQTGYMGLGQIGYSVVETFRPDKWENEFKDPTTGKIDSLAVKEYLFNPVENLKLSLENLECASNYCRKNYHKWDKSNPMWNELDLDKRRKIILLCYNAGPGIAREVNGDWKSKKLNKKNKEYLKEENKEYPEKIMETYYNPKIKVKL